MAWTTAISSDEVPDMVELMLWVILVLVMIFSWLLGILERRLRQSDRR